MAPIWYKIGFLVHFLAVHAHYCSIEYMILQSINKCKYSPAYFKQLWGLAVWVLSSLPNQTRICQHITSQQSSNMGTPLHIIKQLWAITMWVLSSLLSIHPTGQESVHSHICAVPAHCCSTDCLFLQSVSRLEGGERRENTQCSGVIAMLAS